MSCFDRRRVLTLFAAATASGGLAACGFRPLYREGGGADALLGAVALQEAASPEDFAYRERLRRRLGGGAGGELRLVWDLAIEEDGVATTSASDITRFQVTARARYRLLGGGAGAIVSEGAVRTVGAYDATASVYATRAARRDERERLAVELAELTAARLLAQAARAAS